MAKKKTLNQLEQESYDWYINQTTKYRLKRDQDKIYKKMERRGIQSGSFVTFSYNRPKGIGNPSALPFFDKNPVDVILEVKGGHILALNFHYVPRPFRKSILAYIIKMNKSKIKNDKRFELHYREMKEYIKRNGLEIMIRKYIVARITKLTYIRLSEVYHLVHLPTEKIVIQDRDMTRDELDKLIYSHASKTRKAKNRRYGR